MVPDGGGVFEDKIIEALERLGTLREKGLLTDAEFQQQKAVLLGGDIGHVSSPPPAPEVPTTPTYDPAILGGDERTQRPESIPPPITPRAISPEPASTFKAVLESDFVEKTLTNSAKGYRKKWLHRAAKAGALDRTVGDQAALTAISRQISWNWAAFFLSLFWMVYRKLRYAWIVVALYVVISVVVARLLLSMNMSISTRASILDVSYLLIMVAFGLFGDGWLLSTVIRDRLSHSGTVLVHKSWRNVILLLALLVVGTVVQLMLMPSARQAFTNGFSEGAAENTAATASAPGSDTPAPGSAAAPAANTTSSPAALSPVVAPSVVPADAAGPPASAPTPPLPSASPAADVTAPHAAEVAGVACHLETRYGDIFDGEITGNPYTGSEKWERHYIADGKLTYVGPWSTVTFIPADSGKDLHQLGKINGTVTFVRPKNNQGQREESPSLQASEVCVRAE